MSENLDTATSSSTAGLDAYLAFVAHLLSAADGHLTRALGVRVSEVDELLVCADCGEPLFEMPSAQTRSITGEAWDDLCFEGEWRRRELIQLQNSDEINRDMHTVIVEGGAAQRTDRDVLLDEIADGVASLGTFVSRKLDQTLDVISMASRAGLVVVPGPIRSAVSKRSAKIAAAELSRVAQLAEMRAKASESEANLQQILQHPVLTEDLKRLLREVHDSTLRALGSTDLHDSLTLSPTSDTARGAIDLLMEWLDTGEWASAAPRVVPASERKLEAAMLLRADLEELIDQARGRLERMIELCDSERPSEIWDGPLLEMRRRIGRLYTMGFDHEVVIVARAYLEDGLKRLVSRRLVDVSTATGRPDLLALIDAAEVSRVFTKSQKQSAHRIRRDANRILHDRAPDRARDAARNALRDLFAVLPAIEGSPEDQ